jgi:hypothetical protein
MPTSDPEAKVVWGVKMTICIYFVMRYMPGSTPLVPCLETDCVIACLHHVREVSTCGQLIGKGGHVFSCAGVVLLGANVTVELILSVT